jgi:hypothetical protein
MLCFGAGGLVQVGRARIEFHGDNLAETVEEEREAAAREERQARYGDHYIHSYNSIPTFIHPSSYAEDRLIVFSSVADPDPSYPYVFAPPGSGSVSISQRYGSGSFYNKIVGKENVDSYCFVTSF